MIADEQLEPGALNEDPDRVGDVVVQRGTNHRWQNHSGAPCRFAWILLDAQPASVDGRSLEAGWER